MSNSVIDKIFSDLKDITKYLEDKGELSYASSLREYLTKNLLLAIASYYEKTLGDSILNFVDEQTEGNKLVYSFVENKAISRQFHTFFDWKNIGNANKFFALFGSDFKAYMVNEVNTDNLLSDGIIGFMEICASRNSLVHENFGSFVLTTTAEDIYDKHKAALLFLEKFPKKLREFSALPANNQ